MKLKNFGGVYLAP